MNCTYVTTVEADSDARSFLCHGDGDGQRFVEGNVVKIRIDNGLRFLDVNIWLHFDDFP